MERIASFSVDHRKISRGMFISRIDGDVVTYDLRMCVPNAGSYLNDAPLHTLEHLLATHVRNSRFKNQIVYAGPMGCRTGFYLLVRDTMSHADTLALLKESMAFIAGFSGPIPGASEPECGNWLCHDLPGAKVYAADYLQVLEGWSVEKMTYPQ